MHITFLVIALHLAIFFVGMFANTKKISVKKPSSITVRTIVLDKERSSLTPQKKMDQMPSSIRTHQNPINKTTSKKQMVTTPKQTVTTISKEKKEKLQNLMHESLNNLNKTRITDQKEVALLDTLASEKLFFERNYQEELIQYLEQVLTFPEEGEVKLKLTISREGSVVSMQVLQSASKKNVAYIETMLPSLYLPAFGTCFKNEKNHTFIINLLTSL